MYKQLSLVDLVKAVKDRITDITGLTCYDAVPKNAQSPLCFVEVVGSSPMQSKTMQIDTVKLQIHCIAEKGESSIGIYELLGRVQEALAQDIELPEGFDVLMQKNLGIQTIYVDETKEKHAVAAYEFRICSALKCK